MSEVNLSSSKSRVLFLITLRLTDINLKNIELIFSNGTPEPGQEKIFLDHENIKNVLERTVLESAYFSPKSLDKWHFNSYDKNMYVVLSLWWIRIDKS